MRWGGIGSLATGAFSGLMAGYLLGLTIGFTLFDPDLDLWALLGAVLAIAGALLGLLPGVRRKATVLLGAVAGYYLGMLGGLLLYRREHAGLLEVLHAPVGMLLVLLGTVIGVTLGWRLRDSMAARATLLGLVLGGFLLPLILSPSGTTDSDIAFAPLVLVGGVGGSVLAYALYRLLRTAGE